MLKLLFIFILALLTVSCNHNSIKEDNYGLKLNYSAPFLQDKIPDVETLVKKIAVRWGFEVLEKNKNDASKISGGKKAFGIFLSKKKGRFNVFIGNIGVNNILVLGVVEDKLTDFSKVNLEKLANEIVLELKKIDINMVLNN